MATQIHASRFSTTSVWLRVIAWLFKLAGALFALMALVALAGFVAHWPQASSYSATSAVLILSAFAITLFATGFLLARQSMFGAVLALVLDTYPTAFALRGGRPLEWYDIVIPLVTIAVIVSVWPQLSWRRTAPRDNDASA